MFLRPNMCYMPKHQDYISLLDQGDLAEQVAYQKC